MDIQIRQKKWVKIFKIICIITLFLISLPISCANNIFSESQDINNPDSACVHNISGDHILTESRYRSAFIKWDSENNLHLIWNNTYNLLNDSTGLWNTPEQISIIPYDKECFTVDTHGNAYIISYVYNISYIMRNASTGSWSSPERVSNKNAEYYSAWSQVCMALDLVGNVHLIWTENMDFHNITYSMRNSTTGLWSIPEAIWTSLDIITHIGKKILTVDGDGNLYMVWEHNSIIYSMIRNASLGSWYAAQEVTTNPDGDYGPSITIDSDKNIHLLFIGHGEWGLKLFYKKWNTVSGVWTQEIEISTYDGRIWGYFSECDSSGYLHVTWVEEFSIGYCLLYKSLNIATEKWSPAYFISDYYYSDYFISVSSEGKILLIWVQYEEIPIIDHTSYYNYTLFYTSFTQDDLSEYGFLLKAGWFLSVLFSYTWVQIVTIILIAIITSTIIIKRHKNRVKKPKTSENSIESQWNLAEKEYQEQIQDKDKENITFIDESEKEPNINESEEKQNQVNIEKLKQIMKTSDRVKLKMFQTALKLDDSVFSEKVFDLAEKYNFRVSGDEIIFQKEDMNQFIEDLDNKFLVWNKNPKSKGQ